jgi:hypothetical protein
MQIRAWSFSDVALGPPKPPLVDWRQHPHERTLTLTVRVSGSSGRGCSVGDQGTAVVIDRDLINSTNNVHTSAFSLGDWTSTCLNQTFDLDGLFTTLARSLTGPPLQPGQFAVLVSIACSTEENPSNWNPVACNGLTGP